jgi:flagellar biosynthesis protein FlhG
MHDQASELRQMMRQRLAAGAPHALSAPLVVVSGGKGGVGTTTVAVNLAVALARQGRRAVFVDADLDHGGHSDLAAEALRGSVIDVLAGRRSMHEALERGPSGIQVLLGEWASGESCDFSAAAHDRFVAELKNLAPHADVVVVDAGSSRSPLVRRLWSAASAVVVVATTDATAVMNAYAAIKTMAVDGESTLYTVVNRVGDAAEAAEVHLRIAAACRKFLARRTGDAGFVPDFAGTGQRDHVLICPARCEAARALDRTADTLWAQLQVSAQRQTAARRGSEAIASGT